MAKQQTNARNMERMSARAELFDVKGCPSEWEKLDEWHICGIYSLTKI